MCTLQGRERDVRSAQKGRERAVQVPAERVLVVYDDLDLPTAKARGRGQPGTLAPRGSCPLRPSAFGPAPVLAALLCNLRLPPGSACAGFALLLNKCPAALPAVLVQLLWCAPLPLDAGAAASQGWTRRPQRHEVHSEPPPGALPQPRPALLLPAVSHRGACCYRMEGKGACVTQWMRAISSCCHVREDKVPF